MHLSGARYSKNLKVSRMLLPENIHPNNSLYLAGGFVLKALESFEEARLMDLYFESRRFHEMPMPLFVLALDWLFLAGLISHNSDGSIISCF
ncbi:ABC-three component system middle component 6 [Pseudomonas sp. A-B-26]|uniref:ABC-three component system middle component 6 n=1 Tax=Pseudomonas sp. A-B-26 TaxID=2832406 RepID=UPI00398A2C03